MAELEVILLARELLIQRKVQPEHVHSWFSEQPKIGILCELGNQLIELVTGDAACFRDAPSLHLGERGTDVRIEARRGLRYSISRNSGLRRKNERRFLVVEGFDQLHIVQVAVGDLE